MLARAGLTPDSVPEAGRTVPLRDGANASQGGTSEDVTDIVHPSIAGTVIRAARVVGIDIAGVDIITTDITRPLSETGGVITDRMAK